MKAKKKTLRELEAEEIENYEGETDSETEALQEAFAKGHLKPGLNIPVGEKKTFVNNVELMRDKLEEMKLKLPWVERLDVVSNLAPLAPELSVQLKESEKSSDPVVHDDFKRESIFYRQAQDAVLSVLPKLKDLGIPTQRPDDYFAEMAKSDEHMQKVKVHLIKEKAETERVEKVRALRAQKKLQKALNAEAKVAKQNARKDLMNEVKKFRKGETKDLSFLDGNKKNAGKKNIGKRAAAKKNRKDSKFGFGGKKRNLKRNTRESTAGIEGGKKSKGKMMNKRPGKNVRARTKGRK